MNRRDQFKQRVDEAAVARILQTIATTPNKRGRPSATDEPGAFDFWFDGGAAAIHTGWIEYRFADGTRADVAVPTLGLSVTVEFPDGCVVKVRQDV